MVCSSSREQEAGFKWSGYYQVKCNPSSMFLHWAILLLTCCNWLCLSIPAVVIKHSLKTEDRRNDFLRLTWFRMSVEETSWHTDCDTLRLQNRWAVRAGRWGNILQVAFTALKDNMTVWTSHFVLIEIFHLSAYVFRQISIMSIVIWPWIIGCCQLLSCQLIYTKQHYPAQSLEQLML